MYTRNPHDLWMFELVLEGENSQNRHQTDSISIYTYLYRDISIFVIYSDLMYIYIYLICVYILHTHIQCTLFVSCLFVPHLVYFPASLLRRDRRIVIRKVTTCVPSTCSPTPPPHDGRPPKKKGWIYGRKFRYGKYAHQMYGSKTIVPLNFIWIYIYIYICPLWRCLMPVPWVFRLVVTRIWEKVSWLVLSFDQMIVTFLGLHKSRKKQQKNEHPQTTG